MGFTELPKIVMRGKGIEKWQKIGKKCNPRSKNVQKGVKIGLRGAKRVKKWSNRAASGFS